jgi:hypothetical protein
MVYGVSICTPKSAFYGFPQSSYGRAAPSSTIFLGEKEKENVTKSNYGQKPESRGGGCWGVSLTRMRFMGVTGGVEEGPGGRWTRRMIREEEGLFKTNAVWRRWWRKEQEERVMNTRREGKAIVNL